MPKDNGRTLQTPKWPHFLQPLHHDDDGFRWIQLDLPYYSKTRQQELSHLSRREVIARNILKTWIRVQGQVRPDQVKQRMEYQRQILLCNRSLQSAPLAWWARKTQKLDQREYNCAFAVPRSAQEQTRKHNQARGQEGSEEEGGRQKKRLIINLK